MARSPLTPTHTEFQAQVVDLAGQTGWRHLHVRRSIGRGKKWVTATNLIGWPDLTLMHPDVGWVPAELKIPPDTASPEQAELLQFLATLPVTYPKLWTPGDWDDIEDTLVRWPKRARQRRRHQPDAAPGLVETLQAAGDDWGPLGVALTAARLTDVDAVIAALTDPTRHVPVPQ